MVRIGGPIGYGGDPEAYARAHVEFGYRAAYMPNVRLEAREEIAAIVKAMADADVIIAEAGAWKNLITHDEATRKANLDFAVHQLALADEISRPRSRLKVRTPVALRLSSKIVSSSAAYSAR